MKRLLALLLIPLLLLSGCVHVAQPEPIKEPEGKLIYASFYPLYALAERVVKGVPNMTVKVLVQPQDGCLREYDLSEWDIAKIAASDAMIVGGRGLETFESALMDQEEGEGIAAIGAMNGLTLIGQGEEVDGELESHLQGENPWLFLSVDGAEQIMESIAGGMAGLDPGFEEMYADNLAHGEEALHKLQMDSQEILLQAKPQPVALLHEGLPYLAEDLGLNVVCQVDREPGSELYDNDLKAAIDQMNAAGAKVALIEIQAPDQLKQALKEAGFQVALIDTLSTFPIGAGFDHYLEAMKGNAQAVADAFARVSG